MSRRLEAGAPSTIEGAGDRLRPDPTSSELMTLASE